MADGHVEMVDAGRLCMIDSSGGSRGDVLRRIGIARSCMNLLEKNLEVKHQAGYQNTPLPDVPVLLYGRETWSTTKLQCSSSH